MQCRAILTEIVGWSSAVSEPAFGGGGGDASVKTKIINLMTSVRTLMRSTLSPLQNPKLRGKRGPWLGRLEREEWRKQNGIERDYGRDWGEAA
jgi:hypothetical protein